MSMINTASGASDLLPGLIKKWVAEYERPPELYSQFMTVEKMDSIYELEALSTPLGALQAKPQGSAVRYDSAQEFVKPIYQAIVYASGFSITKEAIRSGHAFLKAKKFTDQLMSRSMTTKELIAANVINFAGTSGHTMKGGDGEVLASASHPSASGVYSNILANGADLSELAIESLRTQIEKAVDYRGIKIGLRIKDLLIAPDLRAEAHRILNSNLQSNTADNNANFLKDTGVIKSVIVNPFLTSATQWQVTTTVEDGLKFKVFWDAEMDTDNDFNTKNGLYTLDLAVAAGFTDPKGLYVSL